MKMSNSPLVTYRHITKHKNKGRGGHKIEKIFVHHMAGNLTVKQCGSVFDNRQASAHYGVNGTAIGQYVDESDTAWHCGNYSWNQRSIGIELADDGGASTGWHVSNTTISTAIKLIADICKRNNIRSIVYTGNLNGNLCMHKWVVSTSCPGQYLSSQFTRIANGVNEMLTGKPSKLEVDGIGGEMTVCRMQEFFGTTVDGIISGQDKSLAKHYPSLISVEFDGGGSPCIKKLQRWIGVTQDGVLGTQTIKKWQYVIGVDNDGVFGKASMKAWQKYLNSNEKPVYPKEPVKPTTPVESKPTTSSGGASKILARAKEYAWAYGTSSSKYTYPKGSAKPSYKTALKKYMKKTAKISQTDCGYFVSTCVRASGVSSSFLALPSSYKKAYPKVPSTMKIVHKGKITSGILKAGDIVRYRKSSGQHTVIYLGDGKIAHASRKHAFPRVSKSSPWNNSNVRQSTIQVIRAK